MFFSKEERKKHSCFQPRHHQTPFIPIYHPAKETKKCSCNGDNTADPVTMCQSCGSCYEHSGDTLSTFDSSPKKKTHSGHKCPNSPRVKNGDGKSNDNSKKYMETKFLHIVSCHYSKD